MANHPLDISGLLKAKPVESDEGSAELSVDSPNSTDSSQSSQTKGVRIKNLYWDQLNQESRRMLTSRVWKGVDFNPMLAELDDLSRITEKWLKWAVPTYVNGLKDGPIKEWLVGQNREKDFHYVLVGEHLRHLKDLRERRKTDQQTQLEDGQEPTEGDIDSAGTGPLKEESEGEVASENPPSPHLQASIETLDGHIRWFKQYLQERES